MVHDRVAAAVLERLAHALELLEEVDILVAQRPDTLHDCPLEAARDICRDATKISNKASMLSWATVGRRDTAFRDGGELARGRHENRVRQRSIWKRRIRYLNARARDAREGGKERLASWYDSLAEELQVKLREHS